MLPKKSMMIVPQGDVKDLLYDKSWSFKDT